MADKNWILEEEPTSKNTPDTDVSMFFGDCIFKKCCEKYKKGKRCKKCPKR